MTLLAEPPAAPAPQQLLPSAGATSSLARWRVAARLARREVRRRPGRAVLVVLLVAVPVAALMFGAAFARTEQTVGALDRFGQAEVRIDTYQDASALGRLVPDGLPSASWVEASLPLRSASVPGRETFFTDVLTVDLADPLANGVAHVIDGRAPTGAVEAAVSRRFADFVGIEVGDELTLAHPAQTFTVVGLLATSRSQYNALVVAPGFDMGAVRPGMLRGVVLVGERGDHTALGRVLAMPNGNNPTSTYTDAASYQPSLTLFVWIAVAMFLSMVGIVIAAAFAVSGRRQLVSIGQLSAAGSDPSVLRRFLALQGTWLGLLGAVTGFSMAAALVAVLRVPVFGGRAVVHTSDWAVIAVMAVMVATLAAVLPVRSLATMSPLTALGGRQPVKPVRARAVRAGAALAAGGLVAMVAATAIASASSGIGDAALTWLVLLGAVGSVALLAGVVLLCPLVVAGAMALLRPVGGSMRLAARELDRHRARSGALVASIAVIGAAAFAVGSVVEYSASNASWQSGLDRSVIGVQAYDQPSGRSIDPEDVRPDVRAEVEAVVGPLAWWRAEWVTLPSAVGTTNTVVSEAELATFETLEAARFDTGTIERIVASPVAVVQASPRAAVQRRFVDDLAASLGVDPAQVLVVPDPFAEEWSGKEVPRLEVSHVYIAPDLADGLGLERSWIKLSGRSDRPFTRDEIDRLSNQVVGVPEGQYFVDVPGSGADGVLSLSTPTTVNPFSMWARWLLIGGVSLLVAMVVALGLALWAAEGRDERTTLNVLGAGPTVAAGVVARKALLLAAIGGVLALPLGYGTLVLLARAASSDSTSTSVPFPWAVALAVMLVIPIVIAAASGGLSLAAQHRTRRLVRPGQLD
ncbi:MAG: FtsX-like permease family protein [Actinomycetota bacterium]